MLNEVVNLEEKPMKIGGGVIYILLNMKDLKSVKTMSHFKKKKKCELITFSAGSAREQ